MLEYEENSTEEQTTYVPYSLGYDEEQSLNEIEYAISKGNLDDYDASDFRDYLKYLKAKLSRIRDLELSEGNKLRDIPNDISRVQGLLSSITNEHIV